MDNPFADLQKEREERVKREQQKRQAEEEAKARSARAKQERALQYDEIVTSVLEQLRQAMYPDEKLGHPTFDEWNLGSYVESSSSESRVTGSRWRRVVTVTLEFNNSDQPTHFICWGFDCYKSSWPGSRENQFQTMVNISPRAPGVIRTSNLSREACLTDKTMPQHS